MHLRLLFPLILLVCAGCSRVGIEEGRAVDGVLDLREAPLDRPIRLTGTWLARASSGPTNYASFHVDDADWSRVPVPALFEGQGFSEEGLVWYRLRVLLPENGQPLSGYLKYARNASAIYAATGDGSVMILGRSGEPHHRAIDMRASRRPFAFVIPAGDEVVLSWKVSNFDYQRGGVPVGMVIGAPDVMHRWFFRGELDTLLVSGIYLILMLFFGGYWWWNRRDSAALTVSVLAFVTMVRAAVVEGHFELFLGEAITFEVRIVLEAITFFLLPGLTLLTVWALFPEEYLPIRLGRVQWNPPGELDESTLRPSASRGKPPLSAPWRRLNTSILFVMLGVGGAFSVITVFAPPAVITHFLTAFRGLTLAMLLLTPITLFQIIERRRPMGGITFTAFSVVILCAAHDILLSQGILNGSHYIAPYGLLAFLLLQGYQVARRSAENAHVVRNHARILEAEIARHTRDLKAAMIASEAANMAKTQFLNAVSHEIRTPLTSIIGFTQILEEELPEKASQQDMEFVQLIRESGDRLLRLVNDLLDLAKIETGKLDLEMRDVSLRTAVYEVIRESTPTARARGLTLTAAPEVEAFVVRADPMRLHQVILNLVTNALKFTEEGGVTISAEASLLPGTDEEGRPAVAVSVADTGCGMSREFLPHVFERFTQELRTSKSAVKGTGLGLALTRELVLRMSGRIEVESEPGGGSIFTVWLPLAGGFAEQAQAAPGEISTIDR